LVAHCLNDPPQERGAAAAFASGSFSQHSLERTFTGHLSVPTQIQLPDLARPPSHMRQLQTHYFAHFLLWELLGMALRPPRFLFHPGQTFCAKNALSTCIPSWC